MNEHRARPTYSTANNRISELRYSSTLQEVVAKEVCTFTAEIVARKIIGDTVFLTIEGMMPAGREHYKIADYISGTYTPAPGEVMRPGKVTSWKRYSFDIPEEMLTKPKHLYRAFVQGAGIGAMIHVGRRASFARYLRDYLAYEFDGVTVEVP